MNAAMVMVVLGIGLVGCFGSDREAEGGAMRNDVEVDAGNPEGARHDAGFTTLRVPAEGELSLVLARGGSARTVVLVTVFHTYPELLARLQASPGIVEAVLEEVLADATCADLQSGPQRAPLSAQIAARLEDEYFSNVPQPAGSVRPGEGAAVRAALDVLGCVGA